MSLGNFGCNQPSGYKLGGSDVGVDYWQLQQGGFQPTCRKECLWRLIYSVAIHKWSEFVLTAQVSWSQRLCAGLSCFGYVISFSRRQKPVWQEELHSLCKLYCIAFCHLAVIKFQMCYCVPDFIKIGWLPRDAMHKRGLCQHAVSIHPSVTFVDHVKTNKHISENFSPSSSHTILVFPYQMGWQYSDGTPPIPVATKIRTDHRWQHDMHRPCSSIGQLWIAVWGCIKLV